MAKKGKREALSVSRLINEVLVAQLSIPFRQIVNDTTFSKYTGSKRPDLLISEFEYDGTNDDQYIKNLVAYAEAKDDCKVDDKDWKDALNQGKIKAPKLGLPYFIVTNCKTTYFYNAKTLKQLTLNGNPIREFQTIDEISLKWLSIQYKSESLLYASSSDNGTWNMTGFFEHTKIDIPSKKEQDDIVTRYEKLEKRIELITSIEKHYQDLLQREIA